jgi:ADP-heptose:LPS heptosyltransferase
MKILIGYITGVGNSIMAIPMLKTLRRQLPEAEVHVLVRHQASKELLERVECQQQVHVFHPKFQRSLALKMRFLWMLRQERYDVHITTFPSNRRAFHLLSAMIGARRRIALRYEVGHLETFGFLQTDVVDADANRHEVDQNLALLTPLGVNAILAERNGSLRLTPAEQNYAADFLQRARLTPQSVLVGFHPGCNPEQGNILRRWPARYFAELGDRLAETHHLTIVLGFGGPDEQPLYQEIAALMTHAPVLTEPASILQTAALIRHCRLFLAGDSGLMHLACLLKVPTIALSGPIDPVRDGPLGAIHTSIKATLPCSPCNLYPHFQHGGSYIRCRYHGQQRGLCMQQITVDQVYAAILRNYAELVQCDE